jgi:hypothetical protein
VSTSKHKVKIAGRDPLSQLYRAVNRFVESKGGFIVVIGGVLVQQFPGEPKCNFHISVGCTGQKPEQDKVNGAE